MIYTLTYQMYKYEHGLTAAEQRAADIRAGEAAAALATALATARATALATALATARATARGDLGLRRGRAFRLGHRVRPARRAADAATALVRVMSGAR
jgi:hypothetical protein